MEDGGAVVEDLAEAVAAKIPHHRAALRLRIGLDGRPDIVGPRTFLDDREAPHEALIGDLAEALGAPGHVAHIVQIGRASCRERVL